MYKKLVCQFHITATRDIKRKKLQVKKNIPYTTKSLFVLVHQYLFNNLLRNLK